MKAVIGLGNPGQQYSGSRHNIGVDVLAELGRRQGASQPGRKFEAEVLDVMLGGEKVLLVAPQTYMNLSGRSVRKVFDFYQMPLDDLLVVCDDINLETGRLRLRPSGSAGGQKGLDDIIRRLGTQDFSRLRVGVGRPPGRMDASSYVLQRFREDERELMGVCVAEAADAVELWCRQGIEAAMNRFNAPPPPKKKDRASGQGDSDE